MRRGSQVVGAVLLLRRAGWAQVIPCLVCRSPYCWDVVPCSCRSRFSASVGRGWAVVLGCLVGALSVCSDLGSRRFGVSCALFTSVLCFLTFFIPGTWLAGEVRQWVRWCVRVHHQVVQENLGFEGARVYSLTPVVRLGRAVCSEPRLHFVADVAEEPVRVQRGDEGRRWHGVLVGPVSGHRPRRQQLDGVLLARSSRQAQHSLDVMAQDCGVG